MTPSPEERDDSIKQVRVGKFTRLHAVIHILPNPEFGIPALQMPAIIIAWKGSDLPPFAQSLN